MGFVDTLFSNVLGREVSPGEIVIVDIDAIYAHDGTAPLVIDVLEKELKPPVLLASTRTFFFMDHLAPAPHVSAASVHRKMRAFSEKHGINLYDIGNGICHQVMVDEGIARPGMIIMGADSHTPTLGALGLYAIGVGSTDVAVAMAYGKQWIRVPPTVKVVLTGRPGIGITSKDIALSVIGKVGTDGMIGRVVEFHGDTLRYLSIDARLTLTNMCTEMTAESAVIPIDEVTERWLTQKGLTPYRYLKYDSSKAFFIDEIVFEVSKLEPVVAAPPDVDNVKSINEVEGIEVDQVYIGSCTNGRLEDLEIASRILKGRKVHVNTRCIVSPASRKVYMDALEKGYIDVLIRAGCVIAPPTCGPCVGAHMGILAEGDVAVSTTNRNFPGRMGHKDSKVYLASPAVAAATAVEGKITDPRKYLGGV
ncbi:MAG: 3-isopropylmalate dehydratase large subunit [Desulfurococcaceae archaeon]